MPGTEGIGLWAEEFLMDKTDAATVFDHPYARSVATGHDPLDRISVRDYVREVEIGAFTSERGVTQRIRFNIVLEVARHTAAQDDDVDKVVSYDGIIDAIEAQLAGGRINLLETLAERIAEAILSDRRAVRAFVRVEKLDRIPGALGVEIVRSRLDSEPEIRPVRPSAVTPDQPDPLILALSEEILSGAEFSRWIDAASSLARPVIFCLPPLETFPEDMPRRVALLSFDQAAWLASAADPRLSVISTRTELEHAIKSPRLILWAPAKMVSEATSSPDFVDQPRWLQNELRASVLMAAGRPELTGALAICTPDDLKGE
jgi:7,8-dihydroneopterin aldolase/epimerase/oxygenase